MRLDMAANLAKAFLCNVRVTVPAGSIDTWVMGTNKSCMLLLFSKSRVITVLVSSMWSDVEAEELRG